MLPAVWAALADQPHPRIDASNLRAPDDVVDDGGDGDDEPNAAGGTAAKKTSSRKPMYVYPQTNGWICLAPPSGDYIDEVIALTDPKNKTPVKANAANHASLWIDQLENGTVHALMLDIAPSKDDPHINAINQTRLRVPNKRLLERLFPPALVARARECGNIDPDSGCVLVPTCMLARPTTSS